MSPLRACPRLDDQPPPPLCLTGHRNWQITQRLRNAVLNYGSLLVTSRNLEFFTSFYRYFISVLPVAVVAPLYFKARPSLPSLAPSSCSLDLRGPILPRLILALFSFSDGSVQRRETSSSGSSTRAPPPSATFCRMSRSSCFSSRLSQGSLPVVDRLGEFSEALEACKCDLIGRVPALRRF